MRNFVFRIIVKEEISSQETEKKECEMLVEYGKLKRRSSLEIRNSGVSIGFECLDREMFDPEKCYDLLAAAGVKWARCQTGWAKCEKEKGVFDFGWLDDIVDNLLKRGIQPWFNVGFGNPVYMESVTGAAVGYVPLYYGEECLAAWKRFVRACAEHFAGRIRRWEIWNEPDCSDFWQPKQADPLEYARLIRETAPEIRALIPDAEIGSCSSSVFKSHYTPQFIGTGIGKLLDFHCVHFYQIQPEKNLDRLIGMVRTLFDRNGGTHVKLCQGEAGYASWFPENHWMHPYVSYSERNQAKWLLRRFLTDFGLGLSMSSFFQMADMMGKDYKMAKVIRRNPARHGILNGLTYTPKLSYEAMSHLCSLFDCDTIHKDLPCQMWFNADPLRPHSRLMEIAYRTVTFERNGSPMCAYWLPEDVQLDWQSPDDVAIEFLERLEPLNEPVLVDLLTGTVSEVTDEGHIPLRDYPLVLTERNALRGLVEKL